MYTSIPSPPPSFFSRPSLARGPAPVQIAMGGRTSPPRSLPSNPGVSYSRLPSLHSGPYLILPSNPFPQRSLTAGGRFTLRFLRYFQSQHQFPATLSFLRGLLLLSYLFILRQGLSVWLRLASNSQPSTLSLLSAGITDGWYHSELTFIYLFI